MSESFHSRVLRWRFNLFPAFRSTGARVTYIANDLHEIRIRLPLSWKTKNYVGTIFGGSMFSAVDPFYMVMFIRLLGPEYIVWDKAATIRFRRPGKSTLTARFFIDDDELEAIRSALKVTERLDRNYSVVLIDEDGTVCAEIEKTVHFRYSQNAKKPK